MRREQIKDWSWGKVWNTIRLKKKIAVEGRWLAKAQKLVGKEISVALNSTVRIWT